VYLNHPSWWDGHMCFLLLKMVLRQQHEGYLMMEEKQLRAYRFFTWCGAFSVNRHDADSATRSVNYIARLLRRPKPTLLFIFPQGKIAPNDRRPITAYPGAARVAQQVGRVTLLPVGLRYEFRGEQRPEAWMLVGPAHVVDAPDDLRALSDDMARRLTENADDLQQMALSGQTDELKTLIPGRPGVNRVFDMVFGSLMRRMKR
jgi:1-acyl-sn-glycerol-3-phosphate acyltransferase